MGYQFLRSAPEDVGVDTASLVLFLERIKSGDFDATTMLLMRHNQIFLQYSKTPYTIKRRHALTSITKTITAIAAGFAVLNQNQSKLNQLIQSFTIPFPSGGKFISSTSFPNQYMGENQISNRYVLSENPLCLTAIRFDFERFEVEFYENKQSSVCRIGYRQWIESETYADEMTACGQHYYAMHTPVSLAGAWENTVFHMRCVYVTMPIIDDLYISFENEGENIVIEYKKSERSFGNCDTRIYGEKQNN